MIADMRVAYGGIREERARIAHIYVKFDRELYAPIDIDTPAPHFHPKLAPSYFRPSLPCPIYDLSELPDPTRESPPLAQRTLAKIAQHG
jgi:hypothetical protein